jgi:hypothetical protein
MHISNTDLPAKGGSRKARRARRRAIAEKFSALRKQERLDRHRKEAGLQTIVRERIAGSVKQDIRASLERLLDRNPPGYDARQRLEAMQELLPEIAPGLVDPDNAHVLNRLVSQPWVRSLQRWSPRGHSLHRQLISLVDHLLVRYRIPAFIMRAFFELEEAHQVLNTALLLARLGRGESVSRCIAQDTILAPLTRRMGHIFLHSPAGMSVQSALLRAQVLGHGGDEALACAVIGASITEKHGSRRFWDEVIHWFCRQLDLDLVQVGPLVDYIEHRRCDDRGFKLKGRTVRSLTRGMEKWHRELDIEHLPLTNFNPSGLSEATWHIKNGGELCATGGDTWTVMEILSSRGLATEGRAMGHCIASYASMVASGDCSIWSLRCNEVRRLTVEVSRQKRAVVQARGRFNRMPKPLEMAMLRRWARKNHLGVDSACRLREY